MAGNVPYSSIASGASGIVGTAMQAGFNALSMEKQQKYNVENYERELADQRQLAQDSAWLQKVGLQNAGYSVANPSAVQFDNVSNNAKITAPVDGTYNGLASAIVQSTLAGSQAALNQAQVKKLESETEGQDIQNYLNATYGDYREQAGIRNMNADTEKKVEERIYTAAQSSLTKSQQVSVEQHLQMDWIKLEPEVQLLCAQVYQLETAGELNKANVDLCYQKIKESQEAINTMITQQGLNRAQAATAYALANLYAEQIPLVQEQTRLTGNQASTEVFRKGLVQAQEKITQFQDMIMEQMGLGYYKAKSVAEAVLPIGFLGGVLGKLAGTGRTVVSGFGN